MFRSIARSALIALAVTASASTQAGAPEGRVRYDNWKVVEVILNTPDDLDVMLSISEYFWASEPRLGRQLWSVAPEDVPELAQSGLAFEVLHENFQELLDREEAWLRERGGGWYDNYKTFAEINDRIDALVAARPDLVTKFHIGDSLEARPVYGMMITSPAGSNKPGLLFNGTQHAREWIGPMTVMYIADELVANHDDHPQVRALLDETVFYIIPVANPDGYVYTWTTDRMWRKNRRDNGDGTYGVDLNRNWPVGWGGPGSSDDPGSNIYRGTAPFSEPETVNLRDFILSHTEIVAHIDFHSYAQLILYPYGYDYVVPPEPELTFFQTLSACLADVIFDVHAATYVDEPAHTRYLASGIMTDWVYDEADMYSWAIELRPDSSPGYGFLLPPDGIIVTGEEILEAVEFLAQYLTRLLVFRYPDGLPTAIAPDQTTTIAVTITEAGAALDPNSPTLLHRIGGSGSFTETGLTPLGGDAYEVTLPAAACNSQIQYYFQAETAGKATVNSPPNAPTTLYVTDVAITVVFADDMEGDQGWTVGAPDDDATGGVWTRMNPDETVYRNQQVQPEDDHSPGGSQCWVTDGRAGDSAFSYDVDGGKTTLISPTLNLADTQDPVVSYWRWYYNNAVLYTPDDVFEVDISNDDGASWVNLEACGPDGVLTDGGWFYREFHVADFVTPTAHVKLRFVASDYGEDSLVEAAVDDFQVIGSGCGVEPCLGDLDGDGLRDLSDLCELLAHYGMTGGAGYEDGDLDSDGDVDVSDLSALLGVYGTPCP
jgi:murein tripeptide amidase MpaA